VGGGKINKTKTPARLQALGEAACVDGREEVWRDDWYLDADQDGLASQAAHSTRRAPPSAGGGTPGEAASTGTADAVTGTFTDSESASGAVEWFGDQGDHWSVYGDECGGVPPLSPKHVEQARNKVPCPQHSAPNRHRARPKSPYFSRGVTFARKRNTPAPTPPSPPPTPKSARRRTKMPPSRACGRGLRGGAPGMAGRRPWTTRSLR